MSSPGDPGSTLQSYTSLITSEHNQKPKFMAMVAEGMQAIADCVALILGLPQSFDLDNAVGVQLDICGLWIGQKRQLFTPITGIYFTFDTGPGFDRGVFKGPFDPSTGLVNMPDNFYRIVLKAVAAANQWDGTIAGAYAAYAIAFQGTPYQVFIYDFQDMTMSLALLGAVPDPLTLALFTGGYLNLRPAAVGIRNYITPAVAGPVFAFDRPADALTSGFDNGHFANVV